MGNSFSGLWQMFIQSYPPTPIFSVDHIPDLTGRVAIVTGGNTGLGYETIKRLLEHNAKVYLAARDQKKADAAIADLKQSTGQEAIFLELDLVNLSSIKRAAEEFLSKESELHILFNNAGVMTPPVELTTADGYDLQFGTNVLGHFYFTELLMSALLAGVHSSTDHHARIITTSSSGAYLGEIQFETFKDGPVRRKLRPETLYFQSKLANVIIARQIARRYADKGIISISLNPGNINTGLFRYTPTFAHKIMQALWLQTVENGALTQLFAGTMPEALNYNGEYLIPWARLGKCRHEAYDDELGQRLWAWLEDAIKAHETSYSR